jgi:hypothetical protein
VRGGKSFDDPKVLLVVFYVTSIPDFIGCRIDGRMRDRVIYGTTSHTFIVLFVNA